MKMISSILPSEHQRGGWAGKRRQSQGNSTAGSSIVAGIFKITLHLFGRGKKLPTTHQTMTPSSVHQNGLSLHQVKCIQRLFRVFRGYTYLALLKALLLASIWNGLQVCTTPTESPEKSPFSGNAIPCHELRLEVGYFRVLQLQES